MIESFAQELRQHPWIWRGVLLTGCAAFGEVLPTIVSVAHRVFA